MRIAIVGSGISSLCAAYHLRKGHDVTIFEANNYLGGHTNTVTIETSEERLEIDTGFIVFNERTYPNFCRLLAELGVASQESDMSFGVRCDRTNLEYAGTGLNGLFAQRTNLFRPSFWRLLRDWRRFGREALTVLYRGEESISVKQFFHDRGYSREFREQYFFPMGSAIWSCPHEKLENFPIRFIAEFYAQHGLLNLADPPIWRVIRGGSYRYVQALTGKLSARVRLNSPVRSIVREADGVRVNTDAFANSASEVFDHVVMGCHADQSLRLLGEQATSRERQLLSAFPYERNVAVLHTDASVLPRQRRAWASWNYRVPREPSSKATVTYHMNRLQRLTAKTDYFVSLNEESAIDPRQVLRTIEYHHPVFGTSRLAAQARHRELIDHERISYCGAYWGNGFHEDGVNSALAVCGVLNAAACDAVVA
jgi:predicted NAD/FAD-binding protein